MSKKRIVKETLADGTIQYRVEIFRKPLFFLKGYWKTDTCSDPFSHGTEVEAVFNTLKEAERFAFDCPKEVVKREVLDYE